ncbi:unnamed protein product [Trifolium pratense]|uniref:Uncharacterized protein n=1 Tax=Trifolium pratense TaxID=57577 RepID=A0ACB0KA27_TRIPR|nr:unnamed protein product [Trifolium pratense]
MQERQQNKRRQKQDKTHYICFESVFHCSLTHSSLALSLILFAGAAITTTFEFLQLITTSVLSALYGTYAMACAIKGLAHSGPSPWMRTNLRLQKALSETPELPQTLEVKGGKKRGREDVDLPKQPLPKKSRLSWTPDLDKQFLSAVNQLGV